MELWQHFIVSAILAIILYPLFGIYSLFAIVGGFLIDIDHIVYYIIRFRKFGFKKAQRYYQKLDLKGYKEVIRIFHTIEFNTIIVILAFINQLFLILLIGIIPHLIMDMINEKTKYGELHNYSLLEAIKNNNTKSH
jgi:hypothetical protein